MLGDLRNEILSLGENNFNYAADSFNGILAISSAASPVHILVYDLSNGKQLNSIDISGTVSTNFPTWIRFINSSTIAMAFFSTVGPTFLNINTGTITSPSGTHTQIMGQPNFAAGDYNTVSGKGLYTSGNTQSSNLAMTLFDTSTKAPVTASSLTWMGSSVKVYSIVAKPGSGNFLIGQSDGYIREVDPTSISTTPTNQLVLEPATYDGSSVHQPAAINLVGDNLVASTWHGTMLKMSWSAGGSPATPLERRTICHCSSTSISNPNGASFMMGKPSGNIIPIWVAGNNVNTVALWDISTTPMTLIDSVNFNSAAGSSLVGAAGLDSTTNTLWVLWQSGRVSIFDATKLFTSTAKTKIVSSSVPVSGKILRVPLLDNTSTFLESSTSISAVETSIATKYKNTTYLEIALTGSGITEKADARLFTS